MVVGLATLFAVVVAPRLGGPPVGHDIGVVVEAARTWPDLARMDHLTLRPAVTLPVVALGTVWGVGPLTLATLGALAAGVLAGATTALGARFGRVWAGFVASIGVLVTPWVERYLGHPHPDVIAAGAVAAALAVVPVGAAPRRPLRLAVTTAAIGVAALARAPAAFVVVPVLLVARPRGRREVAASLLPLAAAGIVQAVHDVVVGGTPALRLTSILGHDRSMSVPATADTSTRTVVDVLLGFPLMAARLGPRPLWLAVLLVGLLGLVVLRRHPLGRLGLGVLTAVALPLWLTGGLLGAEVVLSDPWVPRLWLVAWPPLLVAGTVVLGASLPPRLDRVVAGAVAVSLVLFAWLGPGRLEILEGGRERLSVDGLRTWLATGADPPAVLTTSRLEGVVEVARRDLRGRVIDDVAVVLVTGLLAEPDAPVDAALLASVPDGTVVLLPTEPRLRVQEELRATVAGAGWRRAVLPTSAAHQLWLPPPP